MAFLETERLELDPLEEDHLSALQAINHTDAMRSYGGINRPRSFDDLEDWLERDSAITMGIFREGEPIGYIGLYQGDKQSQTEEIYAYLLDEETGNGYGPEAVEAFMRYAFEQLHVHKIYGRCYADNEPSKKMMERLGMTQEGRFREEYYARGQYRDLLRYGVLREEFLDTDGA